MQQTDESTETIRIYIPPPDCPITFHRTACKIKFSDMRQCLIAGFRRLKLVVPAIAVRPARGERILSHEVRRAARFAHGIIQMA